MNEQKVVQEILYMLYLFQKENGTMLKARPKPEEMNHREVMVLQAICRMHPDGTPVKMSDLRWTLASTTPSTTPRPPATWRRAG